MRTVKRIGLAYYQANVKIFEGIKEAMSEPVMQAIVGIAMLVMYFWFIINHLDTSRLEHLFIAAHLGIGAGALIGNSVKRR